MAHIDDDLMAFTLEKAQSQGVQYADVKWMQRSAILLSVKNEIVETNTQSKNQGIGVKILVDGGYGFAATNILTKEALEKTAKRAFRVAKASGRTMKKPIELAEEPIYTDTVATPMKKDPGHVEVSETFDYLMSACKALEVDDPRIKARTATYNHWKDQTVLWTSEGSRINQTISVTGGGLNILVVEGGDTQVRGYPGGLRGDLSTAGYEYFESMDLVNNAPQVTKEALGLLEAKHCPARNDATVIIAPGQLMLQLHENGHGFEMDRAYDYEAAFAGTSFIKPHLMNKLNFGNELVTIYADATHPGGLGTFFYDQEGVKAQKTTLVENGTLVGYMSSRETAGLQGWERSSGSARSTGYDRMPLIRMTNINLKPGDWDYDEMIEDTKDGYIMDTNVSWSIDDLRLSFQFGTEIGWRVENGEITGLVKNPSYTGITPKFWNSVSAVCNEKSFQMYGTPNCGKGEPTQVMYTGHGASPTRFENVRIGVVQK
ncbi:MAG: TldD/PmbA family protein [Candidatus Heimdallarchaeota archaeon]|nr:TldD/PmbA family protein [Candidatus Heimdallarchaeota archaeon]